MRDIVILVFYVCVVLSIFVLLWMCSYNDFVYDDKMDLLKKENKRLKRYNRKLLKEDIETHNENVYLRIELEKGRRNRNGQGNS